MGFKRVQHEQNHALPPCPKVIIDELTCKQKYRVFVFFSKGRKYKRVLVVSCKACGAPSSSVHPFNMCSTYIRTTNVHYLLEAKRYNL